MKNKSAGLYVISTADTSLTRVYTETSQVGVDKNNKTKLISIKKHDNLVLKNLT